MKNILLAIILVFGTSIAIAQNISKKEVPIAVINAYLSQNSKGAQDSVWSKQIETIYKVFYTDDGKRYESQYFDDGRWVKTFTEISQINLLPNIISQVKDLYPNYKIVKSYVELNNDGKFYALDLEKGKDTITIYFSPSGKFIK